MVKIVVFDFDGTIADTFPVVKAVVKRIKNKYSGEEFNFDDIKENRIQTVLKKRMFRYGSSQ